jgi:adenylate kinase
MLSDKFGYISLSTGDMLREEAKTNTELLDIMKQGKLINDDIVFKALENYMNKLGEKPYILDGFPRTIIQAQRYDDLLKKLNKDLGIVVYMDVEKEELQERVTTRVVCPTCKKIYSTRNPKLKPKQENICDDCNSNLIQREDDKLEVFNQRYAEYLDKTSPLIEYYEKKGLLTRTDKKDTNEIFELVVDLIS